MKDLFKTLHVAAASAFTLLLTAIVFGTDNPLILAGVLLICLTLFALTANKRKPLRGLILFTPFALTAMAINLLFVWEGRIILFEAFGRRFTLESLLYASVLSFKLLLVIYVFMLLEVMVDSDRALSYFSSRIPKSTLMILIALKLFPNMKNRLTSLREVYRTRGVDLDDPGILNRARSNLPVLSVLLENSLEGAFDIGEAAYVRGFLSGKRSLYEKQAFGPLDILLLSETALLAGVFLAARLTGNAGFPIYDAPGWSAVIGAGPAVVFLLELLVAGTLILYRIHIRREGLRYGS